MTKTHEASFRARARIFSLLGDELIGSDQLAIFELVKNSYDADAQLCLVGITGLKENNPKITVIDDGDGMSLETIQNVWLEPGADFRKEQREKLERTNFDRLPLGEKGVGRFAVHKLGNKIKMTTKQKNGTEYEVDIDWNKILQNKYLDEIPIEIVEKDSPEVFKNEDHGTHIEISGLKDKEWNKAEIRKLQRTITAICSPFGDKGLNIFGESPKKASGKSTKEKDPGFVAELEVSDHSDWLEDIPKDISFLIDNAPWKFQFNFDGNHFKWRYLFEAPLGIKISGRKKIEDNGQLLLPASMSKKKSLVADEKCIQNIGPISGELIAYDFDPKIRKQLDQIELVQNSLKNHAGVRVYRDNMRVYNYGEPGDDWLGLDLRRVNKPAGALSRNIVVGQINIELDKSTELKEKTNREGFDENPAYEQFRELVLGAIHTFEVERGLDKDRLKSLLSGDKSVIDIPVEKPLAELRKAIKKEKVEEQLGSYVDKIEKDYLDMKEILLKAGMAGINMSVIFHEIERGLRHLHQAIKDGKSKTLLESISNHLMHTFEGIAALLKKKKDKNVDVKNLIQHMTEVVSNRYKRHQVSVKYSFPEKKDEKLVLHNVSYDLLLGTLMNLIDNSIYWLRVRWPDAENVESSDRKIYLAITDELPEGRALIIADNGPGFKDDPDVLTRPFVTRRPDGMGLGLYYASIAMQLSGGKLLFPDSKDLDIPKEYDGAVLALSFPT